MTLLAQSQTIHRLLAAHAEHFDEAVQQIEVVIVVVGFVGVCVCFFFLVRRLLAAAVAQLLLDARDVLGKAAHAAEFGAARVVVVAELEQERKGEARETKDGRCVWIGMR